MNDKMKLLTSVADIEAAIKSIANRGAKLDADIQLAALSCIQHLDKHGDVTLVNRLYVCMPKGSRKSALSEWLLAFAKVQPNGDPQTRKELPFAFDKSRQTDMEGAIEKAWFEFKPDPRPDEVFDFGKALHSLLQRAGKANSLTNPELYHQIKSATETYEVQHPPQNVTAAA